MTLTDINNLNFETSHMIALSRMLDYNLVPEGEPAITIDPDDTKTTYARIILHANLGIKPTKAAITNEIEVYKSELIVIEQARLDELARVQNLIDRIAALDEPDYAHAVLNSSIPNAILHRKVTILKNANHAEAEANLVILEAKDVELASLKAAKEANMVKKKLGKIKRKVCEEILNLIAGNNSEANLSEAQIDSMETLYTDITTALRSSRAKKAKRLITEATPDGVFITESFKTLILQEFTEVGL